MRPYLSIIVPYHNSTETIGPLLASLRLSVKPPPFEVLVVDDGSALGKRISDVPKKIIGKNRFPLRTIIFSTNKGPAVARNTGAKHAKGKFLLFLDGDVRVFPDTLTNIAKIYKDDPDVVALTGVWVKEQKSKNFFPNFKALRDWSYWIHEKDSNGYYYLFSTRIASIKRVVFHRLKGFDEKYAGPLVEDIEFTYRIARRYAVIFAPTVRVHHEFEEFWPIATKYFWRTYYWIQLYKKRKKFDPVATTQSEATSAVVGVGGAGLLFASLFIWFIREIAGYGLLSPSGEILVNTVLLWAGLLGCALLLVHLLLVWRFLSFVRREKGMIFAIQSFFVGLALYGFIVAGAFWGKIR